MTDDEDGIYNALGEVLKGITEWDKHLPKLLTALQLIIKNEMDLAEAQATVADVVSLLDRGDEQSDAADGTD